MRGWAQVVALAVTILLAGAPYKTQAQTNYWGMPQMVCMRGLGSGWADWAQPPTGATLEALRRGYTVNSCRQILSCYNALNDARTGWKTDPAYARDYDDLKQQGLTAQACRQIVESAERAVGRTSASAPPTEQGAAAPRAPDPLIVSIQTLLTALRFDAGQADGYAGRKTALAIEAFQKSIGVKVDGLPSEELRSHLQASLAGRGSAPPANSPPPAQAEAKRAQRSGTAFFINSENLVTNSHVVAGCGELGLLKNGTTLIAARVIAENRADDLAVLRAERSHTSFLKLRIGDPLKPAESVVVFGYPLANTLSSAGNTTLGNITALSGLRDDSRFIQISAAVQPGNSGGPVLDEAGRLVGVVVSKLNALKIARATGDIPQNVNFAIRVSTLAAFLEVNRIPFELAASSAALTSVEVASRAEAASVQVECYR